MKPVKKYYYGQAISQFREDAIKLHRKRYSEVGFLLEDEKDPYESDSLYFVAKDQEKNAIVGVTRLIFKPFLELPTVEHFTIYDLDLKKLQKLDNNKYAEFSAFTKMPQHEVGMDIIRTVFQYSLHHGITHWICCIDERVYKYLNRVFGPVFKMIGEPKVYLGSISIPCIIDINNGVLAFKHTKPKLYDFIVNFENQILEVSK